jgi:hypothetical protein
MAKGRFGGDAYKPKQLGPEPATAVPPETPSPVPQRVEPQPAPSIAVLDSAISAAALMAIKVPFSSRITYAADQQLKAMAKEGRSQTDLLAEALNLLFKKNGLDDLA